MNRHPLIKDVVKAIYHIDPPTLHQLAEDLGPPPEDIQRHLQATKRVHEQKALDDVPKLDELWCKHALDFILEAIYNMDAILVLHLEDAGFDSAIKCFQPVLENLQGCGRLGNHGNHDQAFAWTSDTASASLGDELRELGSAPGTLGQSIIACSVSKKPLSRLDLPLQSCEAFSSGVAVVVHKVVRAEGEVLVNVDASTLAGAGQSKSQLVFLPGVFDKTRLQKLRYSKKGESLKYLLHGVGDVAMDDATSDALAAILTAGATPSSGKCLNLTAANPKSEALHATLRCLQTRGVVRAEQEGPPVSSWALTEKGSSALTPCFRLHEPQPILKVNVDAAAAELSTWELLELLLQDGWQCECVARSKAWLHKHKLAYALGAEPPMRKVFYVRESDRHLSRHYLCALRTVGDHQQPVPHGDTENNYVRIIAGQAPLTTEQRRRQAGNFVFTTDVATDQVSKRGKAGTSRKRRRVELPCIQADEEGLLSDDVEGSVEDSSSGGEHLSSSSSSWSESSSSSSTSGSSSSSSIASPAGEPPEPPAPVADVDDIRDGAAQVTVRSRGPGHVERAGRYGAMALFCGRFKFTPRFLPDGQPSGWEATCYRAHHEGARCRKTRGIDAAGGVDRCLRELRWWCHQDAPDRVSHRLLDFPTEDALPSEAELDALDAASAASVA